MNKKRYVTPLSKKVALKVSDEILDSNFGNSDHVTVGGDDGYSDDVQGAKQDDFFEDDEFSQWGDSYSPWDD